MSLASNDLLNNVHKEQEPEGGRLAIIESTTTGEDNICRAKVKFYGEEEASNLEIPILYSSEPAVGDIVAVQTVGSSLVIVGKLKKDAGTDLSSIEQRLTALENKSVSYTTGTGNISVGSLSAGGEKVATASVQKTGYLIAGVLGVTTATQTTAHIGIEGFYINGGVLYVQVVNRTTTAYSNIRVYYEISYIKIS